MNILKLSYGDGYIELGLPYPHQVIEPPTLLPLTNLEERFHSAFSPLLLLAKKAQRATVIVSDGTRSTASQLWLPWLIQTIVRGGVDEGRIRILIACGSHRATTESEKKKILGEKLYSMLQIYDHDAKDKAMLVNVGTTRYGTPVLINRLAVETDLLVVTGASSLHYFAGYGGGAKSILPGISSWNSIKTNHFRNFLGKRRNPLCSPANDLDNPIFLDMQEAARFANISFMINVVLASQERMISFEAGTEWEGVARQARRVVDKSSISDSAIQPVDMVIVSAGGDPFDKNLIQAHKALEFASKILKPGGILFGIVRCQEGIGSPPVLKYLSASTLDEFYNLMEQDYHPHGQCAFAMREKCERFRVVLYTDLADDIVSSFGAEKTLNPQLTIDEFCLDLKRDSKIAVIPHGNHVLPRVG